MPRPLILFSEIVSKLSKEIEDADVSYKEFIDQTTEEFSFEIIHLKFDCTTRLCRSKAKGLDFISARLLRECPDLIAKSLSRIFNQSVATGIFPDEWKNVRITPLFKNTAKRTDPSNYF